MRLFPFAATFALIALPAMAQPMNPRPDGVNAAAATGLPADPNYNSNVGVTNDTMHEALADTSNGRVFDKTGQRNTEAQTMRSQQRHAMGESDPEHG